MSSVTVKNQFASSITLPKRLQKIDSHAKFCTFESSMIDIIADMDDKSERRAYADNINQNYEKTSSNKNNVKNSHGTNH